jgi:CheY-like chemotaxis protein
MKDFGVLVVDDDSAILSVIERMFCHFKVKVDCVSSAAEALDRLNTKNYNTMITDLDMPDMDGLELAHEARELFPKLNVVLFTGNTPEQVIHMALDPKISDISEVYYKPYGLGDMLKGIMKKETGKTFLLG